MGKLLTIKATAYVTNIVYYHAIINTIFQLKPKDILLITMSMDSHKQKHFLNKLLVGSKHLTVPVKPQKKATILEEYKRVSIMSKRYITEC